MSSGISPRVVIPKPRYESVEHESFRAIGRCLRMHFGAEDANRRIGGLLLAMGVASVAQLTPFGANFCRKVLERQLPECRA